MTLRIISANVNGIRSATTKGFLDWLNVIDADIVCLQELKAHATDLTTAMQNPAGMRGYFHHAEKKGYSGVGIYTKKEPDELIIGLGHPEFDREGRYIEARFNHLTVISLYLPSGSSSEERQQVKFAFMEYFLPHLDMLLKRGDQIIICGDWNIAHKEIDLKNWKGNVKNSGFLPEERAWLTDVFGAGWIDVYRQLHSDIPGYTWWSNRGQAYAKDVGWRIDYQIATPTIARTATAAHVYKEQKFSDHAPLVIDYHYP